MPLPLFEDPISLNFQNYHFKIRGWIPSSGRSVLNFDTFITKFSKSLALRTEKVFVQDEKVAYIRLISTKDSIPLKDGIKRLCRHITNPENRIHIDRVTTRSLFGISPANNETLICWVEALFKRALRNGPQYLTKIELTETDHIPDWAIVLSFAMIAGINIPGYQVTKLEETNDADNQKDEFNTRMIRLFGPDGIKEGSNFLQHIIQQNKDAPDLTQLRLSYSRIMNEVEDSVENTLDRIKQIQANTHCSKKDLSRSCIQAVIACHNTTLLAAQAMLTDGDILETYCTARLEETEKISFIQSIAAVSFITNAAMACEVVAAPWSWAAVGTWFTAGAWPTVLTVTNPAGLVVGAVGLAILGISSFKESQRKREILRHQNLSILISRSCNVINEASILRYCIVYLDSEKSADAVDRCLEYAGNEELLHFWQDFVKKDEPKRTQRKIERHRKSAATKESNKNNDQSSAQRQVSRCIKELTTAQVRQLRAFLYRFKETGKLDISGSEESGSDESDSTKRLYMNRSKKPAECKSRPQQQISDKLGFKCPVHSCPQPNSALLNIKARVSHYETFHSTLLIYCTVAECHQSPSVFFEEDDKIMHHKQEHAHIPYNNLHFIEGKDDTAKKPNSIICETKKNYDMQPLPPVKDEQCDKNEKYELKKDTLELKIDPIGYSDNLQQSFRIIDNTDLEATTPDRTPTSPSLNLKCDSIESHLSLGVESLESSALSAGFETDSVFSGDETDLEEDQSWNGHTDLDFLDLVREVLHAEKSTGTERLLNPALTLMKRTLVEDIMNDFWAIFNQEWLANIRKCTQYPPAPPSAPNTSGSTFSSDKLSCKSNGNKPKRGYNDDENGSPEEDGNEDPKRPRTIPFPSGTFNKNLKFACPYRKYNPRKYNHSINNWRWCALNSFTTVARVKAHLYSYHLIFQCERCKGLFKDNNERKSHVEAKTSCESKPLAVAEGITPELKEKLRSRKRGNRSEEERWKAMYRILFPSEAVPSPYFEIAQDDTLKSPNAIELSDYEDFSRQELPRVFRRALEAAVNVEAQLIEERVRSQIVNMLQECQDHVFSIYRSKQKLNIPMLASGCGDGNIDEVASSSALAPPQSTNSYVGATHISENMPDLFYQLPHQPHPQTNLDFAILNSDQPPRTRMHNNASDSGYASELSTFNHSNSRSILDTAITDSCSQAHQISQTACNDIGMPLDFGLILDDDMSFTIPAATSGINQKALPNQDNVSQTNPYEDYEDFDWNRVLNQ